VARERRGESLDELRFVLQGSNSVIEWIWDWSWCNVIRAHCFHGSAMLPHDDILLIPKVPRSAECYETCHPDRIKKFPYRPREAYFISTEGTDPQYPQWRHELDHDIESCLGSFSTGL
jgi:hypothetical protein